MLKNLLEKNRSFRAYDRSVRLTDDGLSELVDLTRYGASSANKQALKYYVVSKEADVMKVMPLTKWAKGLPELNLPYPGTEPTAFIVICIDTSIGSVGEYTRDVGIVAEIILLGAVEKGFGGCMIGSFMKKSLSELLSLPENIEPNLVVALGKPAEDIRIVEAEDGNTAYYRKDNIHYVPKRKLDDILNFVSLS